MSTAAPAPASATAAAAGRPRLQAEARRLRLSLDLLLGRRLWFFALLDAALLFAGFFEWAIGGIPSREIYIQVFLVPTLLIAVPTLADAVALERRAGSLDLALSSPDSVRYFLRRAAGFSAFIAAQGLVVMLLAWLSDGQRFPLVYVLLQVLQVCAVVTAIVLFWALRLRTAGAATVAAAGTIAALSKWLFFKPMPDPVFEVTGPVILPLRESLPFFGNTLILISALAIFWLYIRRRLANSESLLN